MTNFIALLGALVMFMAALAFDLFAFNLDTLEAIRRAGIAAAADRPTFERLDRNLDGLISPTEAEGSWFEDLFEEIDLDRDGGVNRGEYEDAVGRAT